MEPLRHLPTNSALLAEEVAEMERMVELLRRKAEAECELARHGVGWTPRQPAPAEIKSMVAKRHRLSVDDLEGQCTSPGVVIARDEAMYLIRQQLRDDGSNRFSLPQIGRMFGERHYTSVRTAIIRHEIRIEGAA